MGRYADTTEGHLADRERHGTTAEVRRAAARERDVRLEQARARRASAFGTVRTYRCQGCSWASCEPGDSPDDEVEIKVARCTGCDPEGTAHGDAPRSVWAVGTRVRCRANFALVGTVAEAGVLHVLVRFDESVALPGHGGQFAISHWVEPDEIEVCPTAPNGQVADGGINCLAFLRRAVREAERMGGGMSAERFVEWAREQGVDLALERVEGLRTEWARHFPITAEAFGGKAGA